MRAPLPGAARAHDAPQFDEPADGRTLILAAVVVVAIAAMLLVRRSAPEGSYFEDGDRASGVFGVLATGFAIFAGFVIFLAFTSYDQSRSGAETEALLTMQQFETAQFLPSEVSATRCRMRSSVTGVSIVHQEWPEMEDGTDRRAGINPWSAAMFTRAEEHSSLELHEGAVGIRQVARPDFRA